MSGGDYPHQYPYYGAPASDPSSAASSPLLHGHHLPHHHVVSPAAYPPAPAPPLPTASPSAGYFAANPYTHHHPPAPMDLDPVLADLPVPPHRASSRTAANRAKRPAAAAAPRSSAKRKRSSRPTDSTDDEEEDNEADALSSLSDDNDNATEDEEIDAVSEPYHHRVASGPGAVAGKTTRFAAAASRVAGKSPMPASTTASSSSGRRSAARQASARMTRGDRLDDDDDDDEYDADDLTSSSSASGRRTPASAAATSSSSRRAAAASSSAASNSTSSRSTGFYAPPGTSWRVPYDTVQIPFALFERRVVEKIIVHRTVTAPADPTDPDSPHVAQDEFLVKYKNLSYMHREWVPTSVIEAQTNGSQRIKRFFDKQAAEAANGVATSHWGDEGFNPAYLRVDRILDEGEATAHDGSAAIYYLVKWENLAYDQASWEAKEDCDEWDPDAVADFLSRRAVNDAKRRSMAGPVVRPGPGTGQSFVPYTESPDFKNGNQLRAYQLEGVNWLVHCWIRGQSSIMADEMGLGKTVQSVAFLHELYSRYGVMGPFLVIAPLSTVPHWEREFRNWTNMNAIVYHGNAAARNLIVDTEFYWKDARGAPVPGVFKFDVLITTYEMVMAGAAQLRPIFWRACVLDEAHKLKNKSSKISELLKGFAMDHRVLLTGTPLQNSIDELWALLNFLDPDAFPNEKAFLAQYGSLKTSADVERLQLLLKPLMLRRLKEDVEKSIPIKEETVIEVELTNIQKKWYRAILERNFSMLKKGTKGRDALPSLINVAMELRKCCIHPYLLAGAEDVIVHEANAAASAEAQYQCMIQASGKLVLLDKLLRKLKAGGHKVLIFSQMTKCLDILADYLRGQRYFFERIDGHVRGADRQAAIDRFSAEGSESFVFLLCTRAGGVGINLTAADTAVIMDSDWNPTNDLQAQARCHRIGQKKPVQIYRLITRNTYEKEMFDRAGLKLGLEKAILQKMDANSAMGGAPAADETKLSKKEVEELLKKGAYGAFLDDADSSAFCDEDIDQILERRATVIRHDASANAGSIFSKATFASATDNVEIDVNDPLFWDKLASKADLEVVDAETAARQALILDEPRQRRSHARATEQLKESVRAGAIASGPTGLGRYARPLLEDGNDDDETDFEEHEDGTGSDAGAASGAGRRAGSRLGHTADGDGASGLGDASGANGPEFVNKWSPTEKLYFERRLMVFGVWHWDRVLAACPRRTVQEVIPCARDLFRFVISKLNPDEDAAAIADIEAILRDKVEPYCLPQGHELPFEGATPRQVTEYRSFLIAAPREYKEAVEKKVKFMVSRLTLLKQVYDLVPRDVAEAKRDLVVPTLSRPPAPWWGCDEDRDLLIGIVKHGYHVFKPMRRDRDLAFSLRRYDPATFQELQKASKKGRKSMSATHVDDDDDDEDDDAPEDPAQLAAAGDGPEDQTLYAWPSKSEIGARLRRVVSTLVRERRKQAAQQAAQHQQQSKAQRHAAAVSAEQDRASAAAAAAATARANRWNKRERTDFYRTTCCLGIQLREMDIEFDVEVEVEVPDAMDVDGGAGAAAPQHRVERRLERRVERRQVIDWEPIKDAANLGHKTDEALDEYYYHTVAQCKFLLDAELARVTGVPCQRPRDRFDGDDEFTLDKAKKLFKRIEFLEFLRSHVLPYAHLDKVLGQAKRAAGLPDWWQSGAHDKTLLLGIAKHGYGRYEAIVQDPEFQFYALAESYRAVAGAAPAVAPTASAAGTINGLPWPKETVLTKRIESLCQLVNPRYMLKADPSQYIPPGYIPPPLTTVYPPFSGDTASVVAPVSPSAALLLAEADERPTRIGRGQPSSMLELDGSLAGGKRSRAPSPQQSARMAHQQRARYAASGPGATVTIEAVAADGTTKRIVVQLADPDVFRGLDASDPAADWACLETVGAKLGAHAAARVPVLESEVLVKSPRKPPHSRAASSHTGNTTPAVRPPPLPQTITPLIAALTGADAPLPAPVAPPRPPSRPTSGGGGMTIAEAIGLGPHVSQSMAAALADAGVRPEVVQLGHMVAAPARIDDGDETDDLDADAYAGYDSTADSSPAPTRTATDEAAADYHQPAAKRPRLEGEYHPAPALTAQEQHQQPLAHGRESYESEVMMDEDEEHVSLPPLPTRPSPHDAGYPPAAYDPPVPPPAPGASATALRIRIKPFPRSRDE
ncbi:hypothetical protein H9P43_006582 [Blastocladiella emersonii ATCC 22665]|nr:hypothetical protein H9P43_006582 [Blastocladiella emersonii ATCC 22665]